MTKTVCSIPKGSPSSMGLLSTRPGDTSRSIKEDLKNTIDKIKTLHELNHADWAFNVFYWCVLFLSLIFYFCIRFVFWFGRNLVQTTRRFFGLDANVPTPGEFRNVFPNTPTLESAYKFASIRPERPERDWATAAGRAWSVSNPNAPIKPDLNGPGLDEKAYIGNSNTYGLSWFVRYFFTFYRGLTFDQNPIRAGILIFSIFFRILWIVVSRFPNFYTNLGTNAFHAFTYSSFVAKLITDLYFTIGIIVSLIFLTNDTKSRDVIMLFNDDFISNETDNHIEKSVEKVYGNIPNTEDVNDKFYLDAMEQDDPRRGKAGVDRTGEFLVNRESKTPGVAPLDDVKIWIMDFMKKTNLLGDNSKFRKPVRLFKDMKGWLTALLWYPLFVLYLFYKVLLGEHGLYHPKVYELEMKTFWDVRPDDEKKLKKILENFDDNKVNRYFGTQGGAWIAQFLMFVLVFFYVMWQFFYLFLSRVEWMYISPMLNNEVRDPQYLNNNPPLFYGMAGGPTEAAYRGDPKRDAYVGARGKDPSSKFKDIKLSEMAIRNGGVTGTFNNLIPSLFYHSYDLVAKHDEICTTSAAKPNCNQELDYGLENDGYRTRARPYAERRPGGYRRREYKDRNTLYRDNGEGGKTKDHEALHGLAKRHGGAAGELRNYIGDGRYFYHAERTRTTDDKKTDGKNLDRAKYFD